MGSACTHEATVRDIVVAMSDLAETVLSLIRTRADLSRWHAANAHGQQMLRAVAILDEASAVEKPALVLSVTQKAIASAMKVIMRADDSSGIIGNACQDLLAIHPNVAARAEAPAAKLIDWMIAFQFDNECDFFVLDVVDYASALGDMGGGPLPRPTRRGGGRIRAEARERAAVDGCLPGRVVHPGLERPAVRRAGPRRGRRGPNPCWRPQRRAVVCGHRTRSSGDRRGRSSDRVG